MQNWKISWMVLKNDLSLPERNRIVLGGASYHCKETGLWSGLGIVGRCVTETTLPTVLSTLYIVKYYLHFHLLMKTDHVFMFVYAVNWSCIDLLISGSCSKSFKFYFLLPLLLVLLNNYTFSHASKPPSSGSSVWVCLSSLCFFQITVGKAGRWFRCFPGTSRNIWVLCPGRGQSIFVFTWRYLVCDLLSHIRQILVKNYGIIWHYNFDIFKNKLCKNS